MANSWTHALSSARKFGGRPEDYAPLHDWFDDTKRAYPDVRHRALRHHSFGIFEAEEKFGHALKVYNADGSFLREVPTRLVAEQHVVEDLGFIPTVQEWFEGMPIKPFMMRGAIMVSRILENFAAVEAGQAELSEESKEWLERMRKLDESQREREQAMATVG